MSKQDSCLFFEIHYTWESMELKRHKNSNDVIRLDAEGNWFHGEYPVLHERTVQFLHRNIALDEQGRFYLTGEDRPVYFEVDDVPYFIVGVERTIAGYLITLTDGSIELLDMNSLWIGKRDVLYSLVKKSRMMAKFSRSAYYEVTKDLKEENGKFVLIFNKKAYPIAHNPPPEFLKLQEEMREMKVREEKIEQDKKMTVKNRRSKTYASSKKHKKSKKPSRAAKKTTKKSRKKSKKR